MRILIIDGQGGGIGARLVSLIRPHLPEGCELVRSQRYGETIIDFILWKIPEK